jgi:hypothetical protein
VTAPLVLQDEILRILESEPRLNVDSVREVLRAAVGLYVAVEEVEAALDGLMVDGRIECVHSARLGPRYSIMLNRTGVDMSEPGPRDPLWSVTVKHGG